MDEIGRIMFEGNECSHPVIGIWNKEDKQSLNTYDEICSFILNRQETVQKCKFVNEGISYVYYTSKKGYQVS